MPLTSRFSKFAALLAAIPLIMPGAMPSASAKEPVRSRLLSKSQTAEPKLVDVELLPGNVISGVVLSAEGVPLAGTEVVVSVGRYELTRVMTDQAGEFFAEVPRGGVYVVVAGSNAMLVRAWTTAAAPPNVPNRITLSPQTTVIRAQSPGGGIDPLLGLLILGGIAAAIAIPVALNNSGHDSPKHSTNNRTTNPSDNANLVPHSP